MTASTDAVDEFDRITELEAEVERLRANEAAAIFSFRETNDMALEEIKRLRAENARLQFLVRVAAGALEPES